MDVVDWVFIYLLVSVALDYGLLLFGETHRGSRELLVMQINRILNKIIYRVINKIIDRWIDSNYIQKIAITWACRSTKNSNTTMGIQ